MQVCLLPRVGGLDFALSPALKPQLHPKEDELTLHKEYRNCGTAQQLPAPLRLGHLHITHLYFIYGKKKKGGGGPYIRPLCWHDAVTSGNSHPFNSALASFSYLDSLSAVSHVPTPTLPVI